VSCVQEALHDVQIVRGPPGTSAGRALGRDPAWAPEAADANADAIAEAADADEGRDPVGNDAPQGGSGRGVAPSAAIAAFRFGAPPASAPIPVEDPAANGAGGAANGPPPP
jgi:hypothetical protein